MDEEKIEKLLDLLKNLPFSHWEIIKNAVDRLYNIEKNKNVPNNELGTFKDDLKQWVKNLGKYKV